MIIIKKGDKFNYLTAIKFSYRDRYGAQYWLFKCDCGKEKILRVGCIKRGHTKSCGCLSDKEKTKHGMYGTRIYTSWGKMKDRCLNKNNHAYKNYGGRGIKICPEWLNSFENFYRDMGERPEGKSIDRIDNNGNYEPSNTKWSTPKEQMNNTRKQKKYD